MVRREPGLVEFRLPEESHAHFPGDVEPKGVHALVLAAPHQSYGMGTEN